MKHKKALHISGAICILISFVLILLLGITTTRENVVSIDSTYKGKNVTLKASYYEVEDAEYAVLICPGYSCDRQKWRPMADLYTSNGLSVMTFDYAGQGASSSTIAFDNAKIDDISVEIADAIEALHKISDIDYDHIILAGHSMGGRSVLRLLYDYNNPDADTTVVKRPIKNVILLSPEVNYNYNAQASLFAGASDEIEEPWYSYNESYTDGVNVYLYGSTADDIVSENDIYGIYAHIGGTGMPDGGKWDSVQYNSVGSKITVGVTSGVLHSYMMYSPSCAKYVNEAVSDITGVPARFAPAKILFVYISWILSLIGLALFISSLLHDKKEDFDEVPEVTDIKKFLLKKLFMWLPGLLAAFLVCCVAVVMPFGSPVMNVPYMCCIAGYGIVMLIGYRKGKFSGTSGKLPHFSFKAEITKKDAAELFSVLIILFYFVWFILWGTMYRLIPVNARLFWVVFATVLMTLGYYVSGCESDMLKKSGIAKKHIIVYNLIQYVALFLLIAFYLVIKSYSGVIGQAQNMIFMYVFSVPLGDYVRQKTGNRLLGALVSAFTFQTFMITSAALISFF